LRNIIIKIAKIFSFARSHLKIAKISRPIIPIPDPPKKKAIISDQGIPWRAGSLIWQNLAEVVGRCNVFFVTHAVVLHSKESSDPTIFGDFGGGSGMGTVRDLKS
jgi:hypothetical protein